LHETLDAFNSGHLDVASQRRAVFTVGLAVCPQALFLRTFGEYDQHMRLPRHGWFLRSSALAGILLASAAVRAQQPQPTEPAKPPAIEKMQTVQNPGQQCVQPPPPVKWQDYAGPFHKTMGIFAQKIDRESVHVPHAPRYKPDAVLCSLETKDKFILFVRESVDPVTFLQAGFSAGISQASNDDPSFGQGMAGYGKRLGASYADQVQRRFFKDFVYPELLSEDPRYYRLAHGSAGKRILHAVSHSFIAYRDNGHRMFNFSELLGNTTGVAIGNLYHPGATRGFSATAREVGYDFAFDSGFDVIREFWPEFSRAFHLPFRYQNEVTAPSLP
jgi:hypothetical protein